MDRLEAVARAEFAGISPGPDLLAAVSSWVGTRLSYVPGSSRPTDGAVNTLHGRLPGIGSWRPTELIPVGTDVNGGVWLLPADRILFGGRRGMSVRRWPGARRWPLKIR